MSTIGRPVIEAIAENLEFRLNQVRTVSGAALDLLVERPDFEGNRTRDGLTLLVQDTITLVSDDYDSQQSLQWSASFAIKYHAVKSATTTGRIDTHLNIAWAVIHATVMQDPTCGGYAIDTKPRDPLFSPLSSSAKEGWVIVNFDIEFTSTINDLTDTGYVITPTQP